MKHNLLDKAYQHCLQHGHRFTDPRARVLKILMEEAKPLGAYDILQRLAKEIESPKPPTVYRAIQFWHQEGFIHCIDSLKSYVACSHGNHIGQAQFIICTGCDFAKELECAFDFSAVSGAAAAMDFSVINCTVEIKGLCAQCRVC